MKVLNISRLCGIGVAVVALGVAPLHAEILGTYDVTPLSTGTITTLPDLGGMPQVNPINANDYIVHSHSNFTSFYQLSPTQGFEAVFISWPDFLARDLSGITEFVIGVTGTPDSVKVEFERTDGDKTVFNLQNVAGGAGVKYYTIPSALVSNVNEIKAIPMVVDEGLAGNTSGWFSVLVDGLAYQITATGQTTGTLSSVPGLPQVITLGGANPGTEVSHISTSEFSFVYDVSSGFAGATILFDDFTTGTNESQDLSGLGNLVLAVTGTPSGIKVEIDDIYTNRAIVILEGTASDTFQYFSINLAEVEQEGVDISQTRFINFVVDAALAGAGNEAGAAGIMIHGLPQPDLRIGAEALAPSSLMPGCPDVITLGGAATNTLVEQFSTGRFQVVYQSITGNLFTGGTILFDDFGTPDTNESEDLSSLTGVVFSVRGDPGRVKVEFEDAFGNRVNVFLDDVGDGFSSYTVPATGLVERGLLMTHVRFINFVIDNGLAGAGNETGFFEVLSAGLCFPNFVFQQLDTDGDGLPDYWEELYGLDFLDDGSVDPDQGAMGDADMDGTDNYSEFIAGTSPVDPSSGNGMDILDAGDRLEAGIDGVGQRTYRFYQSSSLLTGAWEKVGRTRTLYAGQRLSVSTNADGASMGFYMCDITRLDVTPLPERPRINAVGGSTEESTTLTQDSGRTFHCAYNLVTGGIAGISITFDDFGTPEIETVDMTGITDFTIGLSGTPRTLKFEFVDAATNIVRGTYRSLTNDMRLYTLPVTYLEQGGLDLSSVRLFNLVLDQESAGFDRLTGAFAVRTYGLDYTIVPAGVGTGTVTILPPGPPQVLDLGGANLAGNTGQHGTTNLFFTYDVSTGGYDGVTASYDDPGTTNVVETGDLSGLTTVRFGARGHAERVRVEFVDIDNRKAVAELGSLSTASNLYFDIATQDLEDNTLNLSQVHLITFAVEPDLIGTGTATGRIDIITGGLAP